MSEIDDRLDRLESLVANQQDTIEAQRERIEDLEGRDGTNCSGTRTESSARRATRVNARSVFGGLSALVLAVTFIAVGVTGVAYVDDATARSAAPDGASSSDPSGQVGTAERPLVGLYTDRLAGGVTGDRPVDDLVGPGLDVDNRSLSANAARPDVTGENGTVSNVSDITFGDGLTVDSDGDGTAIVEADPTGGSDAAYAISWNLTAVESQSGVEACYQSNATCVYNQSRDDGSVSLTVTTSPETTFATVDFTTTDPGVVSGFDRSSVGTGSGGSANTNVSVGATGTASVTAATTESSAKLTLTVVERPNQEPLASFEYDPSEPNVGDTVQFDATSAVDSDGSITKYQWDFQDDGTVEQSGDAASAETVTHTYPASGTYTANLTVVDDEGAVNSTAQTITVRTPGFERTDATDLLPSTTGQSQSFTFTPDSSIPGGETVTIDLDDPQQASPQQVDYQDANASTNDGTASFSTQEPDSASIILTAPAGGLSDGTQVRVSVENVTTGPTTDGADSYSVSMTRADTGDTRTQTFTVNESTFEGTVDDFELASDTSPAFSDTNWTAVAAQGGDASEVTIADDSTTANSPTHAVKVGDVGSNGGIRSVSFDASDLSEVTVSAAVREGDTEGDTPDAGGAEQLLIQYSDRNDTWVTTLSIAPNGTQRSYATVGRQRVTLTSLDDPEAFHPNTQIRIVQKSTNGDPDTWFVDDVCVVDSNTDCPFGGDGSGG